MIVINKIRELAARCPDFEYKQPEGITSCSNVYGGDPRYENCGCIVGQAVRELGFGIPKGNENVSAEFLLTKLGIEFKWEEIKWIKFVQGHQDAGHTWAEAIECADKNVPEIATPQNA